MRRVVMFSGGAGSWLAAKRVAAVHGTADLVLLFADTKTESADTYAFVEAAAADVGGTLVTVADGRTIWQVFRDERFLGNSRLCPASKHLKKLPCDRWLREHCDPASTVLYVGIDWSESHRLDRLRARYAEMGYRVEAPMCDAPYLTKDDMVAAITAADLPMPDAYAQRFAHNNCGKKCVRAGIGHWAHVYQAAPEAFAEAEAEEGALRALLGDVTILTETVAGVEYKLPLAQLRRRLAGGAQVDLFAIGGCGCMVDDGEAAA